METALDPQNTTDVNPALDEDQIELFEDAIETGEEAYFTSVESTVGAITTGADLATTAPVAAEAAGVAATEVASWAGLIIGVVALVVTILEGLAETEIDSVVVLNNTSKSTFGFDPNWGYLKHGYTQSMPNTTIGPGQSATFIFASAHLGMTGVKGDFGVQCVETGDMLTVGFYDPYDGTNQTGLSWNSSESYEDWYEDDANWFGANTGTASCANFTASARVSSSQGPVISTYVVINDAST